MLTDLDLKILQIIEVNDFSRTITVEICVGLSWEEPRFLFNNFVDWKSIEKIKVSYILSRE